MAELVTVFTSASLSEIYIAQAKLEEAGILSFTRDERLQQTAPYLALSNGIQLQVTINDIDLAVSALQKEGIIIPKVDKNSSFSKRLKWIFIVLLILQLLYLLYSNHII